MKNFKKLVGAAMAASMVFAMAGCGSNNGGGGDTFKIGGTGPLTGGAAAYGQAVRNAAQLAVDEINENGGVNGYMLELNYQDDEHDAEKAVNAYNTIKDWGVQIVLGSVTSAPCIAVADKTKDDNIFQLTPSGTAVECTQYDNAFRVCFSDPAQGTASAQYIGEHNLASKVAIIYDSSDVYSTGIYENFVKEAEKYSFEIVSAEAFTQDSNSDFSVQLQKSKDSGADMVFLPIYYKEASLILTQANGMGFAPKFFGVDGMDGILSGVDNFDASLAEGVMFLTPFAAKGEYIVFVDSDDYLEPDMVERLFEEITGAVADIGVCTWYSFTADKRKDCYYVGPDCVVLDRDNVWKYNALMLDSFAFKELQYGLCMTSWGKMFSVKLLNDGERGI